MYISKNKRDGIRHPINPNPGITNPNIHFLWLDELYSNDTSPDTYSILEITLFANNENNLRIYYLILLFY